MSVEPDSVSLPAVRRVLESQVSADVRVVSCNWWSGTGTVRSGRKWSRAAGTSCSNADAVRPAAAMRGDGLPAAQ